MRTGRRRLARERALGILYEAELKGTTAAVVLADLPAAPDEIVVHLVMEVVRRARQVDELIERHSNGWALDRMPYVDRNLLRLAVAEMLDDVLEAPAAVIISEAVELAKAYSTEQSSRFINGLLAGVLDEIGSAGAREKDEDDEGS